MTKPQYIVPSMKEIEELEWNGFNVVSTFSGGGGSCLGYRMAGYRVVMANEFIKEAQATYKANHPDSYLDPRDIREITAEDIFNQTGLKKGEIDIFDGSPPCASFSTAGKRDKGWGHVKKYSDKSQRTDDLFFEYSRLLRDLQPKTFVAENVSGLVKGTAKGYFLEILKELKSCGYNVKAKLLNAKWLGVPQSRQRLIFVGVRNDIGMDPVFPEPLPFLHSVREVMPWIHREKRGGRPDNWQRSGRPVSTIVSSGSVLSPTAYLSGGTYIEADIEHPDMPPIETECTKKYGKVIGSRIRRKFSIAEIKKLGSFPDDFVLTGNYSQKWERVGRSVPPIMMKHISKAIEKGVLSKVGGKEGN